MKNNMIITDVLIIGSGPGGSISGYEIKKNTELKVLILEGGKSKSDLMTPYSSQEMDETYYKSGLSACFGKGNLVFATAETLGGGSEINSGFFLDLPNKIFSKWEKKIKNFSLKEIDKNLKEIKSNLKISSKNTDEGKASKILKIGCSKLNLKSSRTSRWIMSKKISGKWLHKRFGMRETYLKKFLNLGGKIKTNCKALRVKEFSENNDFYIVEYKENNLIKYIKCKYLFICGGAIMTPEFLLNSGIKTNIGKSLQFHQMTRVVAKFSKEKNENDFGVPVRQVNHFKPEMTFGCSVSTKQHLALWMSGNKNLNQIIKNFKKYSIYYSLIKSETKGTIIKNFFSSDPIVRYNVTKKDIKKNLEGLKRLCKILFAGGAERIYLPSNNSNDMKEIGFKNFFEISQFLKNHKYIPELSSIHLFSSVPMGKDENAPLDSYGKLKNHINIYINDASMLPSPTGVNPQGIIMAMAKRNVDNFLKKFDK